jgi:4-nitrophenyl phosphatase
MVLADQPALTPDLLRALVERYQATGAPIVAPVYQGQCGNPVLFDRALFAELLAVEGDQGGRGLIARYQAAVERVAVDDPAVMLDVDTPQDLERVQEVMKISLLQNIRNLIIDLDGVLYRGAEVIPGAGAFIEFLRERGVGFVLATNNSTRTPQQFVDKLAGMGVTVHPDEILTSAQATAGYLKCIAPPGARVFVVGQEGLWAALRETGFTLVEDDAEYVVAGMDVNACYERLAQATLQIRAGASFIGTNPDKTFPSERGIVPGAGSLLAFLEAATGVTPTVIGKPGTTMLEQALARLGASPSATSAHPFPSVAPSAYPLQSAAPSAAMLGDRLETDILAGQRVGLSTILVLSGVTDRAMLAGAEIQPDLVFDDVGHLHAVWKEILEIRD